LWFPSGVGSPTQTLKCDNDERALCPSCVQLFPFFSFYYLTAIPISGSRVGWLVGWFLYVWIRGMEYRYSCLHYVPPF
jgi:hypothetical protein